MKIINNNRSIVEESINIIIAFTIEKLPLNTLLKYGDILNRAGRTK